MLNMWAQPHQDLDLRIKLKYVASLDGKLLHLMSPLLLFSLLPTPAIPDNVNIFIMMRQLCSCHSTLVRAWSSSRHRGCLVVVVVVVVDIV